MEVYNLVLLLVFIHNSYGNFISQHCQSKNGSLLCYNFNLSQKEISEIQHQDFVLSHSKNIAFRSCDIGMVNVDFFSKFPNAERISFTNVSLSLKSSNKITNYWISNHLPLKTLIMASCTISDHQKSNSLKWLHNLENILFYNVTLKEASQIDVHLLKNTTRLKHLNVTNGNFDFKGNVFENFMNLKSLTLRNQRICELNQRFLSEYYRLETLDLSLNYLQIVPRVPETVEMLNLEENKIEYIRPDDFKNMKSLKALSLKKNKLKFFPHDTFNHLVNLQTLNLADNQFNHFTESYIEKLMSLKHLDLRGNFLKTALHVPHVKVLFYDQSG